METNLPPRKVPADKKDVGQTVKIDPLETKGIRLEDQPQSNGSRRQSRREPRK